MNEGSERQRGGGKYSFESHNPFLAGIWSTPGSKPKRMKQMSNTGVGLENFSQGRARAGGTALRLQLLPLIQRQHAPESQQHARVGLFQLGARLRDAIDLRQHLRFVRPVGFEQRLQDGFFLLHPALRSISFNRLC
jgi:hypothetical protein